MRSMRKLTVIAVLFICGFLAYDSPAYAQNKSKSALAIYVVAVKGDCAPNQPVAIYNGRAVALPKQTVPALAVSALGDNRQTKLTKFAGDPRVKELVEAEFKKNKQFRIVGTVAEADAVFHVCSNYWIETGTRIILSGKFLLPTHRVAVHALAIPAAIYRPQDSPTSKLSDAALWRADTIEPAPAILSGNPATKEDAKKKKPKGKDKNDKPLPIALSRPVDYNARLIFDGGEVVEASPLDLVQRFIKEPVELRKKLSAFPRIPNYDGVNVFGKRRPALITQRNGASAISAGAPTGSETASIEEETVKIDTALVIVPVSAMDKDGKYIPGLAAKDFQITENGVKQEISDFGSSESPFNVVLMLDVSGSTSYRNEEIHEAALTFINQLRAQDQVMVVTFDKDIRIAAEFTNNREQLTRAIVSARTGGATRLYDSLDLVLTERLNKIQGRKAIVVFTDGVDTASRLAKIEDVIEAVEESDALVYPVRFDTFNEVQIPASVASQIQLIAATRSKNNYEFAAKFLKDIAIRSGGRFYDVNTIRDTKKAFADIVEELRRQYWLGYYPSNTTEDGSYRRIRVTVGNRPDVVVRARNGYRAAGGDSSAKEQQSASRPRTTNATP